MAGHWFTEVTDVRDVVHGPGACGAIIHAFLRARGTFDVNVSIGVETERPDEVLVLIVINDTKAIFTPSELRAMGQALVEAIPKARALGAREHDEDELRSFAAILIRNADDAAAFSPHGPH
jgi:hypothetical protein